MTSNKKIEAFRHEVWNYYEKHGRHDLPWRKTTDPYKILVSEVMLQQTQVARVVEKYRSFIKKFPTVQALARSDLATVLKEWNGLGYNRRAKYMNDMAKTVFDTYGDDFREALEHKLPGIGPYTRAAVRTFAFNEANVMIETNIRTAYFHQFFAPTKPKYEGGSFVKLSDADLIPIATLAAKGQDPRKWHWALMDYGSFLKQSGVRNNAQSAQYVRQSKFEGSLRQLRGAILRHLHHQRLSLEQVKMAVSKEIRPSKAKPPIVKALAGLERDGLIKKQARKWRIA